MRNCKFATSRFNGIELRLIGLMRLSNSWKLWH